MTGEGFCGVNAAPPTDKTLPHMRQSLTVIESMNAEFSCGVHRFFR